MTNKKKKKWIIAAAIIVGIIIFLNIPIVSDVIAVGRVGMLDRIVDVEKADYDGESRYLFVFRTIEGYEEFEPTFCYVTENNIFRSTVWIVESATGIAQYYTKPTIGHPYIGETVHFTPGEQPG